MSGDYAIIWRNCAPVVAYHFCLALSAAFTQSRTLLLAEPRISASWLKYASRLDEFRSSFIKVNRLCPIPSPKFLRNISAHNAYSESDVSKIVSYANANGLEVIPLVQTFGHLEMALKLDEFKTLREAAGHPQVINLNLVKVD